MQNEVNATGSPAAQDFIQLQNRALQPQFREQDAQLTDALAAQGITNSGAARSAGGDLAAAQSAQIAGADAPLYQQALQQYGAINEEMPQAQTSTYNNAVDQFNQMVEDAASAYTSQQQGNPQQGPGAPSTPSYYTYSGNGSYDSGGGSAYG